MFCKECGNKISDDSKFCCYCGTKLTKKNNMQFKSCFSGFDNVYDDLKVSDGNYEEPLSGPLADVMTGFFGIMGILGDIID